MISEIKTKVYELFICLFGDLDNLTAQQTHFISKHDPNIGMNEIRLHNVEIHGRIENNSELGILFSRLDWIRITDHCPHQFQSFCFELDKANVCVLPVLWQSGVGVSSVYPQYPNKNVFFDKARDANLSALFEHLQRLKSAHFVKTNEGYIR